MSRVWAIVMAVLLAMYLVVAIWLSIMLFGSGEWIGVVLGVALLAMAAVGAWALVREVAFGISLDRLTTRLEAEGLAPARPGEMVDDVEAQFEDARAATIASPEQWQSWLRLSIAYDMSRDRQQARRAARRAVELESVERATRRTA